MVRDVVRVPDFKMAKISYKVGIISLFGIICDVDIKTAAASSEKHPCHMTPTSEWIHAKQAASIDTAASKVLHNIAVQSLFLVDCEQHFVQKSLTPGTGPFHSTELN